MGFERIGMQNGGKVVRRAAALCAGILALSLSGCVEKAEGQSPAQPHSQRGEGQAYELIGSEVWDVPDPVSKRGYQVFVSLPPSYEKMPRRRYPVLYVTDADYAFPIMRQISRRLNVEGPQVEEFILVGLSYAKGEAGMESRRRDYTPTPNGSTNAPAGAVHGQGARYQTYLRDQVKPFIAGRYRIDPNRTFLLGHSYGALLGAQILFTDPEMFSGYILGSPSLWYDKGHIFDMEAAYAARQQDLPAKLFLYVGEYEGVRAGDRRFNQTIDMVGDNLRMTKILERRRYPSLSLKSQVLSDEDHVSVAPRGFTHGLKYLLPAK
jgi:predicted alpha/beta superfamily hydrolase